MKTTRAILTGSLLWTIIFSAFVALNFVPSIINSNLLTGLIVGLLIIPVAWMGAGFYYKKADGNGLIVGAIMLTVAMLLDAFITVPFIEIPLNDRGYIEFFTNPLLWILVAENVAIIYLYWRLKINSSTVVKH